MFEFEFNTIYVKSAFDSSNNSSGIMIHEAAHLHHQDLDIFISDKWVKKFQVTREANWSFEKIMMKNGLVSQYAGFDKTNDKTGPTNPIEGNILTPFKKINHLGLEISLYGHSVNYIDEVHGVFNQVCTLPTTYLSDLAKKIVVIPNLSVFGCVMRQGLVSESYLISSENVAESTRVFTQAVKSDNLLEIKRVYDLLHGNSIYIGKNNDKLSFLEYYGFLSENNVSDLRSSSFLLDKINFDIN